MNCLLPPDHSGSSLVRWSHHIVIVFFPFSSLCFACFSLRVRLESILPLYKGQKVFLHYVYSFHIDVIVEGEKKALNGTVWLTSCTL